MCACSKKDIKSINYSNQLSLKYSQQKEIKSILSGSRVSNSTTWPVLWTPTVSVGSYGNKEALV